jgi:hypothetical protein
MSVYQIFEEQTIPSTMDNVWDFISNPRSLQEITPDHMGFKITTPNLPERIPRNDRIL